eukprot:2393863-Pyramimonas_sp.AAC.1
MRGVVGADWRCSRQCAVRFTRRGCLLHGVGYAARVYVRAPVYIALWVHVNKSQLVHGGKCIPRSVV